MTAFDRPLTLTAWFSRLYSFDFCFGRRWDTAGRTKPDGEEDVVAVKLKTNAFRDSHLALRVAHSTTVLFRRDFMTAAAEQVVVCCRFSHVVRKCWWLRDRLSSNDQASL